MQRAYGWMGSYGVSTFENLNRYTHLLPPEVPAFFSRFHADSRTVQRLQPNDVNRSGT